MHDAPTTSAPSRGADAKGLARASAQGTLGALGGSTFVYLAARAADLDLLVTPPGQPAGAVPYVAVLGAVIVAGAAALVGALVLRRSRRGSRWFLGLSSLVLLGSLASPLGAAEETSTAVVLISLHLVVAVALVPLLVRRLEEGER